VAGKYEGAALGLCISCIESFLLASVAFARPSRVIVGKAVSRQARPRGHAHPLPKSRKEKS